MIPAELPDVALFASKERFGDLGIHAVIDLKRRFTRRELESALEATIRVFPVLGRRYVAGFWRDRWLPVESPISDSVHVIDEPLDLEQETRRWASRVIDAAHERPLRLVSLRTPSGSRLIFSITHLAVDGGGVAAVGHVLGSHLYGVSTSVPADARRGLGSALGGLSWYHAPILARDLAKTLLLPFETWASARRERHFETNGSSEPVWRHLRIGADDLAELKRRCRPRGASVNDALIAALARVGLARSTRGPISVMYTMDLRRYAGAPRLTAANTSSILNVIVPRDQVSDLAGTAAAVSKITSRQRRGLAGPAFILAPLLPAVGTPHAWARSLTRLLHPVLIELPLRRGMVFTNVGRIDDGLAAFGEDVLDLSVIGPNVANIDVPAVVAFGFRGELHLELFGAPGITAGALEELERELLAALEL